MESQCMQPIIDDILPSMAISTFKYDQNREPKQVKWWIIVLGNFDPQEWSKNKVYSPVMSIVKLVILIALAVHHKDLIKT
eukprot:7959361-Ditylum_brightwellii.AAC.1